MAATGTGGGQGWLPRKRRGMSCDGIATDGTGRGRPKARRGR